MPISVFRCSSCTHTFDILHKMGQRPTQVLCPECESFAEMDVAMTLRPARTSSRWGDSQGYFDRGLGQYIENAPQRERIMKERGLVSEADLGSGVAEQGIHQEISEHREHKKKISKIQDLKATGMSMPEAIAEVTAPSTED